MAKSKNYSKEFKLKAVNMYLKDGLSIDNITRELGLKSHSYIQRWLKKFNEFGEDGMEDMRGKTKSPRRGRPKKDPDSLEEKLLLLQCENDYLKALLKLKEEKIKKKKNGQSYSS
jgi:transposase